MAIWQKPLEIADKKGKPTGRFRVVEWSDEETEFNPRPQCKCTNGHDTPAQAVECLKLREIMRRADAEMSLANMIECADCGYGFTPGEDGGKTLCDDCIESHNYWEERDAELESSSGSPRST